MKVDKRYLKHILDFESMDAHRAIAFNNTDLSLMEDIKIYLRNNNTNNAINIIIDTDDLDFTNANKVVDSTKEGIDREFVREMLYRNAISLPIFKHICEVFPSIDEGVTYSRLLYNERVEFGAMITECTTIDEVNLENSLTFYELPFLMRRLKDGSNDVVINVFIRKSMTDKKVQEILNALLNDRNDYHTRFFIEGDRLRTYYDTNGNLMQEMHDYHEFDLCEVCELKIEKTKEKVDVK